MPLKYQIRHQIAGCFNLTRSNIKKGKYPLINSVKKYLSSNPEDPPLPSPISVESLTTQSTAMTVTVSEEQEAEEVTNEASELAAAAAAETESMRYVCYCTNWSQYRPGLGKFSPENIDPFLCTHVIYAFAKLSDDYQLRPFEWNDDDSVVGQGQGMYQRLVKLKDKNPKLKIMIAVGGK